MTEVLLAILALGFFLRGGRRRARGGPDLPATLERAERAGIITAVQRDQILAQIAVSGALGSRLGGAAWLAVFAGLFVVAGVALLIARNWADIGPLARVAAYLVALAAAGEGAIRARERALAVSVPLELLWLFLPLLGIGLYGQTFQLSGDPVQPFLVWLALSAPLASLSPRPVVATVHTFALVLVLFTGNFVVDVATDLLTGRNAAARGVLALVHGGSPSAWLLTAVVLAAIVAQSLRLLPHAHRHHFVGVLAAWVMGVLVAPTAFRLEHPGWLIVAAVALATGWLTALAALETSAEERAPAILTWLAILYGLTFTWHMPDPARGAATTAGIALACVAATLAVAGTLALPAGRLSPRAAWAWGAKLVLVAGVGLAFLYLASDVRTVWTAAVLANVLLAAVAIGLMWHGALVGEVAHVNLGVGTLVVVLVTRFLDVFGGMLQSGIGFIAAGILLGLLAWALERTRRRLIDASHGVTA